MGGGGGGFYFIVCTICTYKLKFFVLRCMGKTLTFKTGNFLKLVFKYYTN
jgi:hypothetical protein